LIAAVRAARLESDTAAVGRQKGVVAGEGCMSWRQFPWGRLLFFARNGQMWRIPADGGQPEAIEGLSPTGSDGFSVHPDGRHIAFVASEQKEEVWVMSNFLPSRGN
jgi:hypothetical protein